ncbi:hypothetical protein CRYUN_Cryun33cG0039600 [Craigia yunnanensis]
MNLSPFKQDIDELLHEFVQSEPTTLNDLKRVWFSRKFSYIYIYEATPTNLAFFMQSLYTHTIGHMVNADSLLGRQGGLYCLYCIYETQPFKPPFKIYLSLGEPRKLKCLVADAKEKGVRVVPTLVKRMLEKKYVSVWVCRLKPRLGYLLRRVEQYLHMDLSMESDLNVLKKMSAEYAVVKKSH